MIEYTQQNGTRFDSGGKKIEKNHRTWKSFIKQDNSS